MSKLASLTDEGTGLFVREGTRAKAVVEDGQVVVDMVVEEPSYVSLTPEVEIDADGAKVFVRVVDRNAFGTGAEAVVETAYSREAPPALSAQLSHVGTKGRSWTTRVTRPGPATLPLFKPS